jgi:excisionase family DNA binding protein
MSPSLITAREVADLLSVPTTWVYEQSRLGRIPTVTLGRYRRYRQDAIEGWIRDREELGSPATRSPSPPAAGEPR